MTPGSTPFRRAPTGLPPHPPQAGPHHSHVAGAGVGPLHLTPAEEEAVAAYLARVWRGATGAIDVPGPGQLVVLVDLTLRKAREAVAGRMETQGRS